MKLLQVFFISIVTAVLFQQCSSAPNKSLQMDTKKNSALIKEGNPVYSNSDTSKVNLTDEEWKKILPQDVFYIARMKGTERPWTSMFEKSKEVGTYYCAA